MKNLLRILFMTAIFHIIAMVPVFADPIVPADGSTISFEKSIGCTARPGTYSTSNDSARTQGIYDLRKVKSLELNITSDGLWGGATTNVYIMDAETDKVLCSCNVSGAPCLWDISKYNIPSSAYYVDLSNVYISGHVHAFASVAHPACYGSGSIGKDIIIHYTGAGKPKDGEIISFSRSVSATFFDPGTFNSASDSLTVNGIFDLTNVTSIEYTATASVPFSGHASASLNIIDSYTGAVLVTGYTGSPAILDLTAYNDPNSNKYVDLSSVKIQGNASASANVPHAASGGTATLYKDLLIHALPCNYNLTTLIIVALNICSNSFSILFYVSFFCLKMEYTPKYERRLNYG